MPHTKFEPILTLGSKDPEFDWTQTEFDEWIYDTRVTDIYRGPINMVGRNTHEYIISQV